MMTVRPLTIAFGILFCLTTAATTPSMTPGKKLPLFELPLLQKKEPLALKKFEGKVVILDFWASWCSPCEAAIPDLIKLQKKYGSQGLQIIGVNVDNDLSEAKKFIQRTQMTFPAVHDKGQKYLDQLSIQAIPTTLLLDRQLKLNSIFNGYHSYTKKKLESNLKKLLKKTSP